jgi:hypothetical protein
LNQGPRHLPDTCCAIWSTALEQKIAEMDKKTAFDLPFPGGRRHGQEIEVVGVFENLFGQIGVGRSKQTCLSDRY